LLGVRGNRKKALEFLGACLRRRGAAADARRHTWLLPRIDRSSEVKGVTMAGNQLPLVNAAGSMRNLALQNAPNFEAAPWLDCMPCEMRTTVEGRAEPNRGL